MNKIGLAVSGGGVRALVFHVGVLRWLAEKKLLNKISFISSVSGGSLCIGLVYSLSRNKWPSNEDFLQSVLPAIKKVLTSIDIQNTLIIRSIWSSWGLFRSRANILGDILEQRWNINGLISELPISPRWIINATCFETGKNWRFMQKRMGDYVSSYVLKPDFKISHAIAASAAYPGLIGPLTIKTQEYEWSQFISRTQTEKIQPQFNKIHLWDGGIYENLGLEPLFKGNSLARKEFDYLIVSDASAIFLNKKRYSYFPLRSAYRLINIAQDQIRSLRSRSLIEAFKNEKNLGVLLKMGNTCKYIVNTASVTGFNLRETLSESDVKQVSSIETTLKRLTVSEFDLLEQHGWEVCEATTFAYNSLTQ